MAERLADNLHVDRTLDRSECTYSNNGILVPV